MCFLNSLPFIPFSLSNQKSSSHVCVYAACWKSPKGKRQQHKMRKRIILMINGKIWRKHKRELVGCVRHISTHRLKRAAAASVDDYDYETLFFFFYLNFLPLVARLFVSPLFIGFIMTWCAHQHALQHRIIITRRHTPND